MSEEQRKDEEAEVEGHSRRNAMTDEPRDDAESDDEVEAHTRKASIPRKF